MSRLWSILACKIPQFLARSYQFGQLTIRFQKVDTKVTKNRYYILSTCHSQILIFQAPANGLNIAVQKRTLKHSSSHSGFICCLMFKNNLNYSYFREIKRPSVLLDFHYNQRFNYNIQNSCWHLCYEDMSKAGRKICCAYKMCESFAWLLCMETLALNFLHLQ